MSSTPARSLAVESAAAVARAPAPATVSLLRYSPALILVLVAVADGIRYADPDLWGHLRFGQDVLSHGHLLRADPYSYSAAGHLWRDHEWLSEVLMAAIYDTFGVVGLKLWKFAATAATISMLALAESETGAPATIQFAVLTAAALALAPQMQFRPQLFSFVFMAAMLVLFARDNYRRRAPVWLIVPLMALWANFHGGFAVGLAILAVYSIFKTIEDLETGRGIGHAAGLWLVTIAATAATLATPYGIGTWYAVAHSLRDPLTKFAINEWLPLLTAMSIAWRAHRLALAHQLWVIGMFVVLLVSWSRTRRVGDLALVALAGLMAAATMVSARNLALFAIFAVPPLARHLAVWSGASATAPDERSEVHPLFALAIAIMLAGYTGLLSRRLPGGINPKGAVAFMVEHRLSGNILADYDWGDYVIWHTVPPSHVFIDGRCETVYPGKVLRDYLRLYFDRAGAEQVLDEYPHDFVLMPPKSGAFRAASRSPRFKLIYRDPVAALFARADSPAAALPPVTTTRPDPSDILFP